MMKNNAEDSVSCGILLALSGGFMDAYSYIFRDKVFANAQTGNVILCALNLVSGDFASATKYFLPISAFVAGILVADSARFHQQRKNFDLRMLTVALKIIILVAVAFIPTSHNQYANALISFVCGIQVESFSTICGNNISTTMCIGNLRNGTNSLASFLRSKKLPSLKKALLYYSIILAFAAGAIAENFLFKFLGQYSIFGSVIFLSMALIILSKNLGHKKE